MKDVIRNLGRDLLENSGPPLVSISTESLDLDFQESTVFPVRDAFYYDVETARTAAALALRAMHRSPFEFREDLELFFKLAAASLDRCLNRNFTIWDGTFLATWTATDSVIASNLLAWVTYSANVAESNTSYYFSLSYAQVRLPPWDLTRKPSSQRLVYETNDERTRYNLYALFALDCANAWLIRNRTCPPRTTTFTQREHYFTHFEKLTSREWHSGTLEAANATLGNLFEVSLTAVLRFAKKESNLNFSRKGADKILQYIRSELGDADLNRALKELYRSHQGKNTDHTTVVGQWLTRIFHRLRCVLLLHAILSQESVYIGAQAPDAINIATKIVCFCGRQVIRRGGPIEDYFLQSWHNFSYLMLGAMGLPDDCPQAGMNSNSCI